MDHDRDGLSRSDHRDLSWLWLIVEVSGTLDFNQTGAARVRRGIITIKQRRSDGNDKS